MYLVLVVIAVLLVGSLIEQLVQVSLVGDLFRTIYNTCLALVVAPIRRITPNAWVEMIMDIPSAS